MKKIRQYSEGKAYAYLKALVFKSEEFAREVSILRKKYGFPDFLEQRELGQDYIEIEKKDLESIAEKFFLPPFLYSGLEDYILTGEEKKLLCIKEEFFISTSKIAEINTKDLLVPHFHLTLPIPCNKTTLNKQWKIIKEMNKEAIHQNPEWKDSVSFDRALKIYRISKTGMSFDKLLKELHSQKIIPSIAQYKDGRNDINMWIKKIEEQIISVQNIENLITKRISPKEYFLQQLEKEEQENIR